MVTLTGTIADVTGRAPDSISSIAVKAPSARIGGGSGIIVTSPAKVTFSKTTGDITISGLHAGLSWLYIEGEGWSDSVPLAVAEGFQLILEAVANASGIPGIADYVSMLRNSEDHARLLALAALDGEFGTLVRAAQNAAETAEQAATSAENTVDSYTPRVDALEAMGGLSPESPADGQTANLIAQPGTLTSAAVTGKIESHVSDMVTSPAVTRIIASLDPYTPLEEGDLLLVFAPPPTEFFTDFTDSAVGAPPVGWSTRWGAANHYKVVAEPDGTGGVVLREEGAPSIMDRALSWDVVGTQGDVEIVMRYRIAANTAPIRPALRLGDNPERGYHAGIRNANKYTIDFRNGTDTGSLAEEPHTFPSGWLITRMRAEGNQISVKTWVDGQPEPDVWDLTATDTNLTDGAVGLRTLASAHWREVDWVGVAIDGKTAPMEPIS